MGSAPVFPYPGGVAGEEPPDPTAGAPGHFAWSRWIKQFVKNLDAQKVAKSGDTMTGPLKLRSDTQQDVMVRAVNDGLYVTNGAGDAYAKVRVGEPNDPQHAATKGYVDGRFRSGFASFPANSQTGVRINFASPMSAPANYQVVCTPAEPINRYLSTSHHDVNGFTVWATGIDGITPSHSDVPFMYLAIDANGR